MFIQHNVKWFSNLYIYIYIHIYIYKFINKYNKFITSWPSMFNETVSRNILPSLGLIKHDVIKLLYYKYWIDKWKYIYIPYISVTKKVLKSWRGKMATWALDVLDVHGASSLYIETYWQSLFIIYSFPSTKNPSTLPHPFATLPSLLPH